MKISIAATGGEYVHLARILGGHFEAKGIACSTETRPRECDICVLASFSELAIVEAKAAAEAGKPVILYVPARALSIGKVLCTDENELAELLEAFAR
jgi:hypothetical protein